MDGEHLYHAVDVVIKLLRAGVPFWVLVLGLVGWFLFILLMMPFAIGLRRLFGRFPKVTNAVAVGFALLALGGAIVLIAIMASQPVVQHGR